MLFTEPLKQNHVFRKLYARGKNAVGPFLVVYAMRNGTGQNRLGVTASTKLGHAVVRNRVRRRLREIVRLNEPRLKTGYELVLVARSRAVGAEYRKLEKAYLTACKKLDLLREADA